MKNTFLSLVFILVAALSYAQVMTGKVAFQKSQQPAAIIELPYSTGVVDAAIRDQLSRRGLKAESSKGFIVFRNMQLVPSDTISSDLYFKVDRKNRKEDNLSVVYLAVARKNENLAARSGETDYGMEQARALLSDLIPAVDAAGLEAQIREQQASIDKVERRYKDLISESKTLENRRRDIETKISENLRDQENQRLELDRQRQALDAIISRRRG